jgi:hypothetical protein
MNQDPGDESNTPFANPGLALWAYGLMLLNLLFPVLLYLPLCVLWHRYRLATDRLVNLAINQAWLAASASTALFLLANALIISLAQYQSTFALITFEVYFIGVIPLFLIPGLLGLVKSLNQQSYLFPLLGRYCETRLRTSQEDGY